MNKAAALLACAIPLALALAADFRSEIIEPGHRKHVDVRDGELLRITNFTQDGGSARAAVIVGAATPTATPSATATPTCSPTCSPSPCSPTPCPSITPTPTPTATPTPKATPEARIVLTAAIVSQSPSPTPEFIKPLSIDGPARITITPGDAAAFITFRKEGHASSSQTATP